jgi:5-methylthioadenosine/S-adenosylhomocysteine deaminase
LAGGKPLKLAKALGIAAACGTIEAGKRADLILVRIDAAHMQPVNDIFSQLVHCAKASDVQTVIVDGEISMRERELTRLVEGKILADAKAAHRDLMQRLSRLSF